MNQTSTASLPIAIGSTLLALAGRGVAWGVARLMHSPMTSTAVIVVSGLSMMAAANALFLQDGYHPAPMFGAPADARPAPVEPVVERPADLTPAPQPVVERAPAPAETPAAAPQSAEASQPAAPAAIGNTDIAALQQKLKEMGLFEGTVDGYYGPQTADAIRAFEARAGMPRTGAATPEVMAAVRNAPLTTSDATPQPQPQPRPEPQPMPAPVAAQPSGGDIAALITASDAAPAGQAGQPQLFDPAAQRQAEVQPAVVAEAAPTPASTSDPVPAALDRNLVSTVQRGLSQLGFLQAPVDGVAGESTAEAIRKFETFHNYRTTGRISYDLVDMLEAAGADV